MCRMGEILLKKGYITKEQLKKALLLQKSDGGLLGIILENLGYIDNKQLNECLLIQHGEVQCQE